MPIETYTLKTGTVKKIKSKIAELLRKKVLHKEPEDYRLFEPGFCLPIQVVPKRQINSLKFGKPEGYRVFIQHADNVLAAADFFYSNRILKLTAVHQGHGLHDMLVTLNKLEKKYARYKEPCYPELIYFLLAQGHYIKIMRGKNISYMKHFRERLTAISPGKLKTEIKNIIQHHKEAIV